MDKPVRGKKTAVAEIALLYYLFLRTNHNRHRGEPLIFGQILITKETSMKRLIGIILLIAGIVISSIAQAQEKPVDATMAGPAKADTTLIKNDSTKTSCLHGAKDCCKDAKCCEKCKGKECDGTCCEKCKECKKKCEEQCEKHGMKKGCRGKMEQPEKTKTEGKQ